MKQRDHRNKNESASDAEHRSYGSHAETESKHAYVEHRRRSL
jgi:hypothetical protein